MAEKLDRDFEWDFAGPPINLKIPSTTVGDQHKAGTYIDEWGCVFTNIYDGIIGEVKNPLVTGENWEDFDDKVHIPMEQLTFNVNDVNRFCASTDKFVLSGTNPRPFEQLQFIRGTENLFVDLALDNPGLTSSLTKMHDFYCELMTAWAKTDVDGISFMDDWGSQKSLLINPNTWIEVFKPLYKDYIDIAHSYGKKIFMHTDGYILDIIPHLIELGLDAINAQIFCMGVENLTQFAGEITFWGEIDRQHILPYATKAEVEAAVESVYKNLWKNGGCIAQCEFGPGSKPENVYTVFEKWQSISEK